MSFQATDKRPFYDCDSSMAKAMSLYLVMMIFGMFSRGILGNSTAVMWGVNLLSFVVLLVPFCLEGASKEAWCVGLLFIATSMISTLVNVSFLSTGMKTLGTHVNMFIPPLYLLLVSRIHHQERMDRRSIECVLKTLSILGCIAVLASWAMGFNDYLAAFTGRMGVYQADVAGFFNNKNIYAIFVSLSICADLLLIKESGAKVAKVIVLLKIIAVAISFSRAALLQLGIMLIAFFLLESKRSFKQNLPVIAVLILVVLAYYQVPAFHDLVASRILRLGTGDSGRTDLMRRALDLVHESNLALYFGVGYAGVSELSIDIDNAYLYEFFVGGAIRLVFVVGFLVFPFVLASKLSREFHTIKNLAIAVNLSYLVYMGFESIAPLELGIINFCFLLITVILPCAVLEKPSEKIV